MLQPILIIFTFLLVGELLKYMMVLPVPGNIIGMVLIFLFLKMGWLKLEQVKPASDKLLQLLPLFFVPYGVGLMVAFDLLVGHWIMVSLVIVVSTILTLYLSGLVQQKMEMTDDGNT